MKKQWQIFIYFILISFAACMMITSSMRTQAGQKKGKDRRILESKNLSFKGYPRAMWRESFPQEIKGSCLARKSGDVLIHTYEKVWLFDSSGKLVWKQGDGRGWKYIAGAGISEDGRKAIFQVNLEPKIATNLLELNVYCIDREGTLLWAKNNPYRYNLSQLSPGGNYIIFGDPIEKLIKVHDQGLNLLWQKELYLWYIDFDPKENFLFDAVEGLLFDMKGRQLWDMGGQGRILSVSEDAEVILTQKFLGRESTRDMQLISRTALKKVMLEGFGGCVSSDGSLAAIVNSKGWIQVFRTKEILEGGLEGLPPIFQYEFLSAELMNFSDDNKSLLVFGKETQYKTRLLLAGLSENKVLWMESFEDSVKPPQVTRDNRLILFMRDPNTVEMFAAY